MGQDLLDRARRLSEYVETIAGSCITTIDTGDKSKPILITTHFDKPFAAVHIVKQPKNTTVPWHNHDLDEWFFVLQGSLSICKDSNDCSEMLEGSFLAVAKGQPHCVTALVDTTYVCISMPSLMDEIRKDLAALKG